MGSSDARKIISATRAKRHRNTRQRAINADRVARFATAASQAATDMVQHDSIAALSTFSLLA
jgi:hypothetical protein